MERFSAFLWKKGHLFHAFCAIEYHHLRPIRAIFFSIFCPSCIFLFLNFTIVLQLFYKGVTNALRLFDNHFTKVIQNSKIILLAALIFNLSTSFA